MVTRVLSYWEGDARRTAVWRIRAADVGVTEVRCWGNGCSLWVEVDRTNDGLEHRCHCGTRADILMPDYDGRKVTAQEDRMNRMDVGRTPNGRIDETGPKPPPPPKPKRGPGRPPKPKAAPEPAVPKRHGKQPLPPELRRDLRVATMCTASEVAAMRERARESSTNPLRSGCATCSSAHA